LAGRGLCVIKADKSVGETPPYTLPMEGIAQPHTFLFLPKAYGFMKKKAINYFNYRLQSRKARGF